jgi:hypothetical protein
MACVCAEQGPKSVSKTNDEGFDRLPIIHNHGCYLYFTFSRLTYENEVGDIANGITDHFRPCLNAVEQSGIYTSTARHCIHEFRKLLKLGLGQGKDMQLVARRCIVFPVRYELNLYMLCRRK